MSSSRARGVDRPPSWGQIVKLEEGPREISVWKNPARECDNDRDRRVGDPEWAKHRDELRSRVSTYLAPNISVSGDSSTPVTRFLAHSPVFARRERRAPSAVPHARRRPGFKKGAPDPPECEFSATSQTSPFKIVSSLNKRLIAVDD